MSFGSQSVSVPVEMKLNGLSDSGEIWEQSYEYIKFRPFLIDTDTDVFEVN